MKTELYLTVEAAHRDVTATAARLRSVLAAIPVASVLIHPGPGTTLDERLVKPLIEIIRATGSVALISGPADLAGASKADGLHLFWNKDTVATYREARGILGDGVIIGADAGRSRDDAMALGDAGADYVAFGIPPHVEDRAAASARQIDLIDWWSEIFEVPCVAFNVVDAKQARDLAAAQADFIAFPLALSEDALIAAKAMADAIAFAGEHA